jgi:hypothetical protein
MGINISITVDGSDNHKSIAQVSGSVQNIISDKERSTFKLNDDQLKAAIEAYFGKKPNDAYLHSPTPWDDLYKRYNWSQVTTVLVAEKAEILGITSEPVIVKSQEFINRSSNKDATYNVSIHESVENTTSSNWSTGGELTIGQSFEYGVKFLGAGGETSMSYTQSWGIGGEHSKSVTVGSEAGIEVNLKPGEGVIAELTASRGVMKVRVTYRAYLIGVTAINYNPKYKDHHFWALNINSVMQSKSISNSIISTEDIEIGYYSNSRIELRDIEQKSILKTYILEDMPGAS